MEIKQENEFRLPPEQQNYNHQKILEQRQQEIE
jgi:hypothetical protein